MTVNAVHAETTESASRFERMNILLYELAWFINYLNIAVSV